MADDDEALRLNTLHRFRKHSSRLLLEEYSHCEVPAGCGGVVLRWLDPTAGTPVAIRVFVEAELSTWLNGVALDSNRVDLRPGPNVLAIACTGIQQPQRAGVGAALARAVGREQTAPLLVSIVRALGNDPVSGSGAVVLLASGRGASSWHTTDQQPPADWMQLDFDDHTWASLPRTSVTAEQRESWRVRQLVEHGAEPLGLAGTHAWVRVRFEVPSLQTRDSRGANA